MHPRPDPGGAAAGPLVGGALSLAADGLLLAVYRDNLLLNVVMLVHPIDAIKSWQAGR